METKVLIIGKGIAGLAMSYLLSRKQIPHLVIERKERIRAMPLGETLPPSALPLLRSCGLQKVFEESAIAKTTGYHSCWGTEEVVDHNFYFHRPFQYGLKMDKERLKSRLTELQAAHIREYDRTLSVNFEAGGVRVQLDKDQTIEAKYLVDATGRKRWLCKLLGLEEQEWDTLTALSCHIPRQRFGKLPHGVFVESFEQGWGIVSELSASENVMTLYTTRACLGHYEFIDYANWKHLLHDTHYLKHFLSTGIKPKVTGGKANSSRPEVLAGKNWMTIGDAAMAFDPLSSHGITSGIYTANQAVKAIEADQRSKDGEALKQYANGLEEIFRSYLAQKQQLYAVERRWPDGVFWKEIHGIEITDTSLVV